MGGTRTTGAPAAASPPATRTDQALRDADPVLAAPPLVHRPTAGGCGLDRRGGAGGRATRTRTRAAWDNDFTNRNTTLMTWNPLHLARMLNDASGMPAHGNSARSGTPTAGSTARTR